MKTKLSIILLVKMLFFLVVVNALADSEGHLVSEYYKKFNITNDGTASMIALSYFRSTVPVALQPDILADILDRALHDQNPFIAGNILVMLNSDDFGPPLQWNQRLQKSIYAQTKFPDWSVRRLLVDLIKHRQKEAARDVMLSLQNDPDDRVRWEALNAIERWPDAKSIYQAYIQAHQTDPAFAKAVVNAQVHLETLRQGKFSPGQ
jgi:hypothetical protein